MIFIKNVRRHADVYILHTQPPCLYASSALFVYNSNANVLITEVWCVHRLSCALNRGSSNLDAMHTLVRIRSADLSARNHCIQRVHHLMYK